MHEQICTYTCTINYEILERLNELQPKNLVTSECANVHAQIHTSLFLSYRYLVDNKMHIRENKELFLSIIITLYSYIFLKLSSTSF